MNAETRMTHEGERVVRKKNIVISKLEKSHTIKMQYMSSHKVRLAQFNGKRGVAERLTKRAKLHPSKNGDEEDPDHDPFVGTTVTHKPGNN